MSGRKAFRSLPMVPCVKYIIPFRKVSGIGFGAQKKGNLTNAHWSDSLRDGLSYAITAIA